MRPGRTLWLKSMNTAVEMQSCDLRAMERSEGVHHLGMRQGVEAIKDKMLGSMEASGKQCDLVAQNVISGSR